MEEINKENVPDDLLSLFDNVDFQVFQTNGSERFKAVSANDVDEFLSSNQNTNTVRKTTGDLRVFMQFLTEMSEMRSPEEIPPEELNHLLCQFILAVRKKDGTEYEPVSLKSYISSIDRYLKQKEYGYSISKDIQFGKTRETLSCKQKSLKAMGKGNKPKTATELTDKNLDAIYEAGNLGTCNPVSLINSMWLICTTHFGMRTGLECHSLRWGDVELKMDDNEEEYLLYSQERQTKTRTGQNFKDVRPVKPRAYQLPEMPEKDPVYLYKMYRSKRPVETLDPDSPFFLAVNSNGRPDSPWYKRNGMGVNKIYGIMKGMKSVNILPSSVRKHLVQKLRDTGLPPTEIIQVTGHRNVNSINNYSALNTDQQRNISHVLSTGDKSQLVSRTSCATSSRPASDKSPGAGMPSSQSTSYSASQSRNFLSSVMTGNSFYGNVTINIVPSIYWT